MMKKTIGALLVVAALALGGLFHVSPASASPCQIGADAGWTTVSQGTWSGYVAVNGPDKWRSVCWIVQTKFVTGTNYQMRVKIQDLVDSDEPDANGEIQALYATPGNSVWRNDWNGTDPKPPKDVNSADWNYVTSNTNAGNTVTDGPPSAWQVQFRVTATSSTTGQKAYTPIVRTF